MAESILSPLPDGARLLHIGPPKTGTTALQAALHRARRDLLEQSVRYAGRRRHSRPAAMAAVGDGAGEAYDPRAASREWRGLIREVRSAGERRVVFSSELLSRAEPAAIRRIVEEFDASRVHVAVTLRSLSRVLPAQWQQSVQSGSETPLDSWLRRILSEPFDDPGALWHRHRHDRLIARWAEVVGLDRMIVIVLDEQDRRALLRAFEQLLDLRDGTLALHRDLSNRSMTWPEIEAVRVLNVRFREAGLSRPEHRRVVAQGACFRMRLREPQPDEPAVRLPRWAAAPVSDISREIVAGIERSGARVVGDLASLVGGSETETNEPAPCIPPQVAATLAMSLLEATGAVPRQRARRRIPGLGRLPDVVRDRVRRVIRRG